MKATAYVVSEMTIILTTKIIPPPLREKFVSRPRLCARLDQVLQRRLALVCAPAGYGKTSLLCDWLQRLPAGDDLDYVGVTALASSALVQDDGTWVLYFYTWDDNT